MKQTNLLIVVGFLGSGKTTFLKNFLKAYSDKKIAVIVNDFSQTEIDAELLDDFQGEIAKINNGSLFCACKSGQFVEELLNLQNRDLDYVIVEASGLADPKSLKSLIEIVTEKSNHHFKLKGVIGIFSGTNVCKLLETVNTVSSQVYYSDLILLNKIDLADKDSIEQAQQLISEINPTAAYQKTVRCQIDFSLIEYLEPCHNEALPVRHRKLIKKNYLIELPDDTDPVLLDTFFKKFYSLTSRIKGFIILNRESCYIEYIDGKLVMSPQKTRYTSGFINVLSISPLNVKLAIERAYQDVFNQELIIK